MFSSPLAHAAEEYLQTTDASVRERTRKQLVSAGASAIEPLVGALIKTLREGKSRSLGRKEMNHFIDELGRQGVFDEDHLKGLRQHTKDMPDRGEGGMSEAQALYSQDACSHTWQVISQVGEPGVRELFRLINGRDKRLRLAALLAMSRDENPSRWIISSLMNSVPFQERPSSEIDAVAGGLVLKVMATGGDQRAMEVLEEHEREARLNAGEYAEAAVYAGIMLLAK